MADEEKKHLDSEEDDDFDGEDEEDDDEEEEEEETGRERPAKRRKKKGRGGVESLFALEAEEDDEEDDDEGMDEEEEAGFVGEDLGPEEPQTDRAQYRQLDKLFQKGDNAGMPTDEELVADLENRHRASLRNVDEAELEATDADISRQSLLPTVKDPTLFSVKCRSGKEKEVVMSLMTKHFRTNDKLNLISVVCVEHIKGYVYIEARNNGFVKKAIEDIPNLYITSIRQVALRERPDILRIPTKMPGVNLGDFVRVKRGLYRGDLAQVVRTEPDRQRVVIKLLPRLDFNAYLQRQAEKAERDAEEEEEGANTKKRKFPFSNKGPAPPQQLFNGNALRDRTDELAKAVDLSRDRYGEAVWHFAGQTFSMQGYLLKTVNIRTLNTTSVGADLEEITKFQTKLPTNLGEDGDKMEEDDMQPLKLNLPATKLKFMKGDAVRVNKGELLNLQGQVEDVDEHTALIKAPNLKVPQRIKLEFLAKFFKLGDHVKVLAGKFSGETGLLTSIDANGDTATLLSDMSKESIKVLTADLQTAAEVSTGAIKSGGYELYDLIQTGAQAQGVIVKVNKDTFEILDHTGNKQTYHLQNIGAKRFSKNVLSTDADNQPVGTGDLVKILDGPYKNVSGTVKHLFKHYAWVFSKDIPINSGIAVLRTRQIHSQNPRNRLAQQSALNGPGGHMGPPMRGGFGRGRGRGRHDELLNKMVVITKGRYRGSIGRVREATELNVHVELQTLNRKVQVNRAEVQEVDETGRPKQSAYVDHHTRNDLDFLNNNDFGRTPPTPARMATPLRPTTPQHEPYTPRTPSHDPFSASYIVPPTPRRPAEDHPATPGGISSKPAQTPTNQYDVATPGGEWGKVATTPGGWGAHTPRDTVPTPGGIPDSVQTPAADHYSSGGYGWTPNPEPITPHPKTPFSPLPPATPDAYSSSIFTSRPYTPTTPGGFVPSTPHSPAVPQTPYGSEDLRASAPGIGGAAEVDSDENWHTTEILVNIIDGEYSGRYGEIKAVGPTTVTISLEETGSEVVVPKGSVHPREPSKKSKVKVIRGEFKGKIGTLMGIDSRDGIVKIDMDIKLIEISFVAPFTGSASTE